MPKSRRRKPAKKSRVTKVAITERTREILENQRLRFREKFGRDSGPSDPVFFDPDAPEPVPMSAVMVQAETIEAMRKAGTPPQIIYASASGPALRSVPQPASMHAPWPSLVG